MRSFARYAFAIAAILVVFGVPLGFALGPAGDRSTKVDATQAKSASPSATAPAPCVMPALYNVIAMTRPLARAESRRLSRDPIANRHILTRFSALIRGPPDYPLRA